MYKAILVHVILYSILLMSCIANYFDDDVRQDPKLTRQFRMRCTRRYSPGVCAGHVSPVWTYMFHEQNCTERIGCANYFRANRFKNYAICMKQCQGLGDVYLKMLEVEDDNKENYGVQLRKGETEPSLLNTEKEKQKQNTLSEEEQEDLSFYSYEQGENETHSIVYNDYLKREDIFPPDVDQVDGEIRSQYDLLHP